ncbi:hypothetical protein ACWOBE_03730 [Hutsoniella sourekii]
MKKRCLWSFISLSLLSLPVQAQQTRHNPEEIESANYVENPANLFSEESLTSSFLEEHAEDETPPRPEDVEGAIVHDPVYPASYQEGKPTERFPDKGLDKGYPENTLMVGDYAFPFVDLRGQMKEEEDFEYLNQLLEENTHAVYVGENNMNTFFGHYYDLSGTGIFNPMDDRGLMDIGVEVVITDDQGLSRGYEITQNLSFNHADQDLHFYGQDSLPYLAYQGNGQDMIYIQYCRWDIELGLLKSYIGYRIW